MTPEELNEIEATWAGRTIWAGSDGQIILKKLGDPCRPN